jgi:predicted DNA-binding protein (MmcQ/YjbR family)
MNFTQLHQHCLSLKAATHDVKWGADHAYCIASKMFAVMHQDAKGRTKLSLKVEPERFLELTDRPGIIPAPYLARAKWVQVTDTRLIPDAELKALIARSHALIAAKLTRAMRRELGIS